VIAHLCYVWFVIEKSGQTNKQNNDDQCFQGLVMAEHVIARLVHYYYHRMLMNFTSARQIKSVIEND